MGAEQQTAQSLQPNRVGERGKYVGDDMKVDVEDVGQGMLSLPDQLSGARCSTALPCEESSGVLHYESSGRNGYDPFISNTCSPRCRRLLGR